MKDRLKEMRITLGRTQKEMSEQSGVTQAAYSMYESGKSTPSNAVINSLCKTFNVNEQWLRTGEGEMFAPKQDGIDEFLTKNHLDPKFRTIAETFFALPEPAQNAFCEFLGTLKEYRMKVEAEALEKARQEVRAEMETEKEDRERQAIHILLDAQLDREKMEKENTLASGGTKSKEA